MIEEIIGKGRVAPIQLHCYGWPRMFSSNLQRKIGGKWVLQWVFERKCKACRNLPRRQHWTGPVVCNCGNPFVNTSILPQERIAAIKRWKDSRSNAAD